MHYMHVKKMPNHGPSTIGIKLSNDIFYITQRIFLRIKVCFHGFQDPCLAE